MTGGHGPTWATYYLEQGLSMGAVECTCIVFLRKVLPRQASCISSDVCAIQEKAFVTPAKIIRITVNDINFMTKSKLLCLTTDQDAARFIASNSLLHITRTKNTPLFFLKQYQRGSDWARPPCRRAGCDDLAVDMNGLDFSPW